MSKIPNNFICEYRGNFFITHNQYILPLMDMVKSLTDRMNIPDNCMYVLFDDTPHDKLHKGWQHSLGHMINYRHDKDISGLPEIASMVKEDCHKNDYPYIVFIFKIALSTPPDNNAQKIQLLWTLCHEFQHLKQSEAYPYPFFFINTFLQYQSDVIGVNQFDIPFDHDANLAAKKYITGIFGSHECQNFIDNKEYVVDEHKRKSLSGIDINEVYDPGETTLRYLCENREKLTPCYEKFFWFLFFDLEKSCKNWSFESSPELKSYFDSENK